MGQRKSNYRCLSSVALYFMRPDLPLTLELTDWLLITSTLGFQVIAAPLGFSIGSGEASRSCLLQVLSPQSHLSGPRCLVLFLKCLACTL